MLAYAKYADPGLASPAYALGREAESRDWRYARGREAECIDQFGEGEE